MSELEQKIRDLSLRAPDQSLDDRILATLQEPTGTESVQQSAIGKSVSRDDADFSPALHSNRRGVVVTSGWLVASVSMLIGAVVGNILPSFSSLQSRQDTAMSQDRAVRFADSGSKIKTNGSVELLASAQGNSTAAGSARVGSGSIASQIVESIWISPTAAAVAWEQQTGQIFNVANHVNDRRFDMCRECHRVGG